MGQTNDKAKVRSAGGGSTQKAKRFDSSRFIQYELDKSQQAACKGWEVSSGDLWNQILALADTGYSVSIKFDTFSEAYSAFVQVRDQPDHANNGLVLTGRGSTPEKAFKQACFKMDAIGPSWGQYAETKRPVIDD